MIKLNELDLNQFLENSRVIQSGHSGPKVIELSNGNYLKLFRLKSWFSSALFWHYADRFCYNASKLKILGIDTLKPKQIYLFPAGFISKVKSKRTKAVQYEILPGSTVRDMLKNIDRYEQSRDLITRLAVFFARLHNLGIYFKACHLGNIIYNSDFDGSLGLIDIDNTWFYHKPLKVKQRQQNFKHLLRYTEDQTWLNQHKEHFWKIYLKNSGLPQEVANEYQLKPYFE